MALVTEIRDVSFVIIARNEAFAVEKCLRSIASMQFEHREVICVDSDSTDDTLDVMKRYAAKIPGMHIIQCTGYVNAAVARNAGMRYATMPYIFFVDGDVELFPEFVSEALERIQSGKADAVTGKLREIQYSPDYQTELRQLVRRKHMTQEKVCLMTGGIFIASRRIVQAVGDWDERFARFQDFDYTLRLSKCGILLQLPAFMGIHHSQQYRDRSWNHLKTGRLLLYGRLLRKNLRTLKFTALLLRSNRGLLSFLLFGMILLATSIAAILSWVPFSAVGFAALVCVAVDCLYSVIIKRQRFDQWLLHNYLGPPVILWGMCLKWQASGASSTTVVLHYGCSRDARVTRER